MNQFSSFLKFDFTWDANTSLSLLVFAYEEDWDKVYGPSAAKGQLTCLEKRKVAHDRYQNAFDLNESGDWKDTVFSKQRGSELNNEWRASHPDSKDDDAKKRLPVAGKCGHSYCHGCVLKWKEKRARNNRKSEHINCMLCRETSAFVFVQQRRRCAE